MRRFVAGWIFCLLASGLPVDGFAQSGTAGDKGAAGSVEGASAPLEKTKWKLIRLGRAAVKGDDLHRPPQLVLDPVSHRASGSGGCNRIMGGYELKGDKLNLRSYGFDHDGLPGRDGDGTEFSQGAGASETMEYCGAAA